MKARGARLLAGVLVATVVAGCTGDDADGDAEEPTTIETDDAPAATEGEPAEGEGAAEEDEADEGAREEAADGGTAPATQPLASVEHQATALDATLQVDVMSAEVVGDLLRVAVAFTAQELDEESSLAELMGSIGPGNRISARLIDADNLLEYSSVRAAVPHGSGVSMVDGHAVTLYFYFAAPEQPMTSFDLQFDFGSGHPDLDGLVDVPFESG